MNGASQIRLIEVPNPDNQIHHHIIITITTMTVSIELPDKHIQIIKLLSEGFTKKEIASKLTMSIKNVERIVYSLISQFDCKNTAGLVSYAHKLKIIE